MKQTISFTINAVKKSLDVDVNATLLEVIRDDLGLTGTKMGCGSGNCGSCSVLIDGHIYNACLYLAVRVDGKDIKTIEGEVQNGTVSDVQQAFIDYGAIQCGFCTPGFVLATRNLKENSKGKKLSRDEIKDGLSGNLCRCTGYQQIMEAAEAVLGDSSDRT